MIGRPVFMYPNLLDLDGVTLSGGSWESGLPLANLLDRSPSERARSTDDALDSAQYRVDLGAQMRAYGLVTVGHNLSLAARYRGRFFPGDAVVRAATATYFDEDGVVQSAVANVLRNWHYVTSDGEVRRVTLIEGHFPENLISDDDITSWDATGTPVITASVSDPAGGTGAYRVADDDGTSVEYPRLDVSFTGDEVKAMSFVCREATMPAAGNQAFVLYDATAGSAERLRMTITGWTDGEPTVVATTGTLFGKQPLSDGYWIIYAQTTAVTAANTNRVRIEAATTGAQTGSIDVWRVNAFDFLTVPPPSVFEAGETRNIDSFTADMIDSTPQATTWLLEAVVLDLPNQGTGRTLMNIGDASDNILRLGWDDDENVLLMQSRVAATSLIYEWDYTPSLYDHIIVRIRQESTGAITAGLTVNGGSEAALDVNPGTQALPSSWGNPRVRFGTTTGSDNRCHIGLIQARGQSGAELTVAQMQALESPDIFDWTVYDSGWQSAYPAIYPTGATIRGVSVAGGTFTDDQWSDGRRLPLIELFPRHQLGRYMTWEFDDTANTDGYIEVGRPFVAAAYIPPAASLLQGAEFEVTSRSTSEQLRGGARVYDRRFTERGWDFDLGYMRDYEAKSELLEMAQRLAGARQVFFIPDPDVAATKYLQSILGVFVDPRAWSSPATWLYRQPLAIREDL